MTPKEEEAQSWAKTQQLNSAEGYQIYLKKYPNGKFSDKAKELLECSLKMKNTKLT